MVTKRVTWGLFSGVSCIVRVEVLPKCAKDLINSPNYIAQSKTVKRQK